MICIKLVRQDGQFVLCKACGHAGFAQKGSDIVCSAVTVLLRTVAEVLQKYFQSFVKVTAQERGNFSVQIEGKSAFSAEQKYKLCCVADFLECGINSVVQEFPEHVDFCITEI